MSDAPGEEANRREIAYRLFAAEYDDADFSYSEGDEERAPNYVVTPTGARVNRAFVVGVLTEVEAVSEDVLRARVVDPTGAFVLYAGQYQPDEQAFLEGAETPTFVAVTGKARTFQPEDADRVYTSIRPETINEVDADTRDRWTVGTAERTLQRVGWMASAIRSDRRGSDLEDMLVADGVDEGFASGIVGAIEHYGTSPAYLSAVAEMAIDAARLVAGETDEVDSVSVRPDAEGEADLDTLAEYADLATVHAGEPTASAADTTVTDAESTDVEGDETTAAPDEATPEVATTTTTESAEPAASGSDLDDTGPGAEESGEPVDAGESAESAESTAEVGDFEPGEFDLDDEEREEIEEEFGTEFQSGTEVDDPGEADIETPESGTSAPEPPVTEDTTATPGDTTATPENTTADTEEPTHGDGESTEAVQTDEPAPGGDDADADDVDLEDATLDVMEELDDGTGADRQAVIETVTERYGRDSAAVEEAIQDALMDGRCYEPDDATLKPI